MDAPTYIHLTPGRSPPLLEDVGLFKAVVVVESDVTVEWREQISDWLVQNGCRYMLAWGLDCGRWDDSVDEASLAMFDFGEIPDDGFVMTTWHEKVSLQETFLFCERWAMHPTLALEKTYLIHIAAQENASALLEAFRAAQRATG